MDNAKNKFNEIINNLNAAIKEIRPSPDSVDITKLENFINHLEVASTQLNDLIIEKTDRLLFSHEDIERLDHDNAIQLNKR